MDYAKQQAILQATLRRPTAGNLSETEAHNRVEAIRANANFARETQFNTVPRGPVGAAFIREWNDMMEREREWN